MTYIITVNERLYPAPEGENLLRFLRRNGLAVDAPCGGSGTCGKCRVMVNGQMVLACQCIIQSDLTVEWKPLEKCRILVNAPLPSEQAAPSTEGYMAAVDIGTTTVVCYLLDPEGREVACSSMLNPQTAFGADVISRIRCARTGDRQALTDAIRDGISQLLAGCCRQAGIPPQKIGVLSVVGNPCMRQLFLGMEVDNLAHLPFNAAIRECTVIDAKDHLPVCPNARMILIADIAGFVGADTLACILASKMYESKETILMVDIGTNGEMVLCHQGRMVACSTAAGPALEGANIQCGMRGSTGAIDHVTDTGFSVIGGGIATGICGSGLIDAIALMLEKGILNKRGRILTEDHCYYLTQRVFLTQEDIRQVQLAKGAIAAGIQLMANHLSISVNQIHRVILAGAFGTSMNPDNACRIGLLPPELQGKIESCGNLAGIGAKMLALNECNQKLSQKLADNVSNLELAAMPDFQRIFARNMEFREISNG